MGSMVASTFAPRKQPSVLPRCSPQPMTLAAVMPVMPMSNIARLRASNRSILHRMSTFVSLTPSFNTGWGTAGEATSTGTASCTGMPPDTVTGRPSGVSSYTKAKPP